MFQPPANLDDLSDRPELKEAFLELWNRRSPDLDKEFNYMGDFVTLAAQNPNYVDPRNEPPTGSSAPVPWNGFPRLLSRFYNDNTSEAARSRAEEVADITTPWLYWFVEEGGRPSLRSGPPHLLPFFAAQGPLPLSDLLQVARPLRALLPDNQLGDPIPQFRRQQDEYLEWHVDRDSNGAIQRVAFSAEPPDYWEALASIAPDRVLELYRRHVNINIQQSDVFYPTRVAVFGQFSDGTRDWIEVPSLGGTYNPLNRWNTTDGIMHLTHRANTLGAEVNLAGQASVARPVDSQPRVPGQDPAQEILRIACGGYGGINRSSDPNIGLAVGDQVIAGNRITLTDPVGLYISRVDIAGLRGPNGELLGDKAGHVVRGTDDPFEPRILRFEIKLPAGSTFTLSDCTFDNRPLRRGGQIARETTIQLYANIYLGSADKTAEPCGGLACRHPTNAQIFTIGGGGCPAAGHPIWLLETPFEGTGAAGAGVTESVAEEVPTFVTREEKANIPVSKGYYWYGRGH